MATADADFSGSRGSSGSTLYASDAANGPVSGQVASTSQSLRVGGVFNSGERLITIDPPTLKSPFAAHASDAPCRRSNAQFYIYNTINPQLC